MPTELDLRLLGLLHAHRVLTTPLAAAAADVPVRRANYRLGRLRAQGLVQHARPYAPSGSAPLHWWLTVAGRQLLGYPGRVNTPPSSPLFLAHAAATAAWAIALDKVGPAAGLRLLAWQREEGAREHWAGWQGKETITPDGYALVQVEAAGAAVPLLVEVDRNSMQMTKLKDKLRRYLAYTAARAWTARHERCPVLLVLTSCPDRASNLLNAAHEERRRTRGLVGELLVGVCEQVERPETAALDPVWRADDQPGAAADQPGRTLAELLVYRLSTELPADAQPSWLTAELAEARALARRRRIAEQIVAGLHRYPPDGQAEGPAGAVLAALTDADTVRLADLPADALDQLAAWAVHPARTPLPRMLADALAGLEPVLRDNQIRLIREMGGDDPIRRRASQLLLAGQLVPARWLGALTREQRRFADCQRTTLGGYETRRRRAVDAELPERPAGTPRARLEIDHDHAWLRSCTGCGLHQPHDAGPPTEDCDGCGAPLGPYDPAASRRAVEAMNAFLDGLPA